MSDTFFLVVGIIIAGIGLLIITAKIMSYIRCTVQINAYVVKLEEEYTYFRGIKNTHYHPVVEYYAEGKSYTQMASFRTYRKNKYPVDSEIQIYYNPNNPEEMRFAGHSFPLPMGIVFLIIGAVLIYCYFL